MDYLINNIKKLKWNNIKLLWTQDKLQYVLVISIKLNGSQTNGKDNKIFRRQ